MRIRSLEDADADAASRLLIASITELCRADHGGDPALVAAWTTNKSPEHLRRWRAGASTVMLLAEIGGRAAGVGACTRRGDILLTYVAPEFRFRGVSRSLLDDMERLLRREGVGTGRLVSTATARSFYLRAGWANAGPPEDAFSMPGYPMRKRIG